MERRRVVNNEKNTLGRVNMKLFTKVALVSAVAISSNAMAMQAMDDEALSATTGQDGISIGIGISKIMIDELAIHDKDGLSATAAINTTAWDATAGAAGAATSAAITGGTATAGAIVVNDVLVTAGKNTLASHNLADITIDTDAGAGGTKPFLNIGAAVSGLDIKLGKIEVAGSADAGDGFYAADATVANRAEILSGLTLSTGIMSANIQLGNTPQGAMIKLNGSMIGGLSIKDLAIKDASAGGGGVIGIGEIKVNDTGSANLALDADIAVTTKGLAITAGKGSTDVYIKNVDLGTKNAASVVTNRLGDVSISGMKVFNGAAGTTAGAVITISGH